MGHGQGIGVNEFTFKVFNPMGFEISLHFFRHEFSDCSQV